MSIAVLRRCDIRNSFETPLTVGQLVRSIANSKTTILKYYKWMMKIEGWIEYQNKELEFGKQERILCLTEKGKKEAMRRGFQKTIQALKPEIFEEFMTNYKVLVVEKILQTFEKNNKQNRSLTPQKLFLRELETLRKDKAIQAIEVIESDLKQDGFSTEEMTKLWLIWNGYWITIALVGIAGKGFFSLYEKFISSETVEALRIHWELNDPKETKEKISMQLMLYTLEKKLDVIRKEIGIDLPKFI